MGLTPRKPEITRKRVFSGRPTPEKNTRKHPPLGGFRGFGRVPLGGFFFFNFSKANNHGHLHQNDKHRGNPRWQTQ